jgi:Kef-type K+ transport system membrane component KefB
MNTFLELASIISLATAISVIAKILKQPLIIGYIITGILAGPIFFNILKSQDQMELFSKVGISVLLFIVGLNLNPKVIKEVGKVSLITGVSQVIITSIIGFYLAKLLGLNTTSSLYVAVALTFGSTIIVLKLLSDKGDYHKLYGKIAVGFLLVQDIIASFILLFTTAFSSATQGSFTSIATSLLLKSFVIGVALYVFNSYVLPKLTSLIASNSELLFLFSLSWGLGLASIFHLIGFSIEIGSLIAGVSLSLTPFAYEIAAKLKPIRDFFVVLFFILLGSQMNLGSFYSLLPQALILSLYVLIGNPLIVILLVNALGHKRKTSFMAGLTVAQISEFSLILATLGVSLGHINQEVLSLITLVGIITIACSSYLILYSEKLFPKIEWLLKLIELKKNNKKESNLNENFEILLFGYDRVGQDFVRTFKSFKKPFLVVDLNPNSIEILNKKNIPNRFGDAEDVDFLEDLSLNKVKLAISTIPDLQTNLCLTELIKKANPNSVIIIVSHDLKEAKQLYDEGASYVVVPHYLGAKHITKLLSKLGINHSAFKNERDKHLEYISQKAST